ncbi:PREDICTED: 3'(2'),5'-bisphosphate nucleotidase 1-like [Amphimedon queenslandica]|uniref:3'(2'),5'-bisphosphate nucleotidase 1 n=1 Tax=Amphimedon queenslandica TaxID=400682 RepID=A0A1X7V4M8_AMPQE|nr:PREDICTED: 3'(2'),5'-bisphosphate nucleotidase 1-like [Amphimedon queenslandica]|eukprot:XP_019850537.1 PREDICTED: 3'(2'),5'-bisphosphate nucleotidase 1-like [Amphimedon queenslandica]
MSSTSVMIRLISASVCAANKSGAIIREVLKTGELGIVQKGVNDPQTEADRRAQRCISATIQSRFPEINLIGEEDVAVESDDYTLVKPDEESDDVLKETCPPDLVNLKENDLTVWVDPLDGTKEFTEGFPEHVTVLIGISYNERPVGGVIHQPFYGPTGRTVWGLVGGAVKGMTPVASGDPGEKLSEGGLRIVVTRSHMSQTVRDAVDALNPKEVLHVGGSGNKILMVLEGAADAYVYASTGTKKWDTCAAEALVMAAGGKLTNVHGSHLLYNPTQIMNSKGVVVTMRGHDDLIARIPSPVKAKFC